MEENRGDGRKVFFLYPHSVIHQEMLEILIMAGYESYTLVDANKAKKLLKKFPGSIMFINIDKGMKESEWEVYIRGIQEDESTKECKLGIMSYNQDKNLMRKYLMEISVPCGYVQLKLGLQESIIIILGVLEASEARGRRRYIRADCEDDLNATLNFKYDTDIFHGKILDISSAGVAVKIEKFESVNLNTTLRGVQLKLRGGLMITEMLYMGKRSDKKDVYILMFTPKMTRENKLIIYKYVKVSLQKYIDGLKV